MRRRMASRGGRNAALAIACYAWYGCATARSRCSPRRATNPVTADVSSYHRCFVAQRLGATWFNGSTSCRTNLCRIAIRRLCSQLCGAGRCQPAPYGWICCGRSLRWVVRSLIAPETQYIRDIYVCYVYYMCIYPWFVLDVIRVSLRIYNIFHIYLKFKKMCITLLLLKK